MFLTSHAIQAGHEILTDKGKLGTLRLPFTPKTWHIKDGKWEGEVPPLLPAGCNDPEKSVRVADL